MSWASRLRNVRRGGGPHAGRFRLEALERREMLAISVLMYHNDPASTGQNLNETALSPQNVNAGQFGKLFSTPLDGQVFAQPLVVTGVNITTGSHLGVHDAVFAATEHDSLYAIDAANGDVLWKDSFINPAGGVTTIPTADVGGGIFPEVGITSTPVIDAATGTIYVEARTKEIILAQTHYVHRLHAIDLGSGGEKFGGPLVLGDTILNGDGSFTYVSGPAVSGSGDGAVGVVVNFNSLREHQRPALSLVNGTVYLAFASLSDIPPYHGWVLGVDADTMTLTAAFNATPNGFAGGIWQSGAGISSDEQGNLYVVTGNGTFDTTLDANGFPSLGNFGDSILKLAVDPSSSPSQPNRNGWGLKVVDYFTPSNQLALSNTDTDLGSGGVLVLPAAAGSAAHPHLLVAADKGGAIYVLDRDRLGGFDPATDHVLQEWFELPHGGFDVPAYFNGAVYYAGVGDNLKRFEVSLGAMAVTPSSASPNALGGNGATPSITAGGAAGIVWVLDLGSNQLLAFDAANLADQLYGSGDAAGGRDAIGTVVNFSVPTIANGRVFAGTTNSLVAYGLLPVGAAVAPSNGQLAELAGFEGSPIGGAPLATFSAGVEPASDFHAAVNWGDGSFSSAAVVASAGAYQVVASHVYADERAWPVTVTISNPAGSIQLTGQAQIAERLLPDGTRGTPGDRFLSELYDDLLGRPIEAGGWSYWRSALSVSPDRAAVVQALETTEEFRQAAVQQLFSRYLRRAAESEAAAFFSLQLAAGVTQEQIAEVLLASPEYFQEQGQGVNSRFLNAVYRDVLGRAPEDGARSFWGQALAAGLSRADLVRIVLTSDEYRARLVGELYEQLLHRPADAVGADFFAGLLAAGGRREQVMAAIAASDEFFAKIAG